MCGWFVVCCSAVHSYVLNGVRSCFCIVLPFLFNSIPVCVIGVGCCVLLSVRCLVMGLTGLAVISRRVMSRRVALSCVVSCCVE